MPESPTPLPDWATLLKRVFAIEVLTCRAYGGERRVIAEIKEGPIARQILAHLGLPTAPPRPGQGNILATGPPAPDEPEPPTAWSDAGEASERASSGGPGDQRLPCSDPFA